MLRWGRWTSAVPVGSWVRAAEYGGEGGTREVEGRRERRNGGSGQNGVGRTR